MPGLILAGIGNGLVNPPISTLAMGTVEPRYLGMASGTSNVARQTGTAFGIAALATLLANRYNRHLTRGIHRLAGLAPRERALILHQIKTAGPIAGSLGLKTAAPQYTRDPLFPAIAAIARHAFLLGTRDTVWLATGFLVVGFLAVVFMVRQRDMVHLSRPKPSESSRLDGRTQALVLSLAAAWSARGGARIGASPEEEASLKQAFTLVRAALTRYGER